MIDFCHISPTGYLPGFTHSNGAHLLLAHLVEEDEEYRNYYANLDDGKYKIMDNSAFEMYKQGREMYSTDDLLPMAELCKADMIVMSDYPGRPAQCTINAAIETGPVYKEAGYATFFVPQSEIGDYEDYMYGMKWALNSELVDRIGLSILGCPNAFGVEKDNRLQRYLSRWKILRDMEDRGWLDDEKAHKKFHCLGMVDGPNEIELLWPYAMNIATWDSSAAVWAGLNKIKFDNSPTGLIDGKFETEVDFSMGPQVEVDIATMVMYNIDYINRLCEGERPYGSVQT